MTIFHPDETETLRETELPKVPPVFRHNPSAAPAAETELRTRFTTARERFVALIESGFQQRTLQAVADLDDPRFFDAMVVFRARNAGFPLSTNLAELWALGDAGNVVLEDLASQLRRFMAAHIRADRLPDGERLSAPSIRIVPTELPISNARPNPTPAGVRVANIPRASLFVLTRYRRDLVNLSPVADRPVITFLVSFLRPNCDFDDEATAVARARRIQDLNVVDRHDAGETIARRGDVVDARMKRVLDALRVQTETQVATGSAARLQADLERARTEASQLQSRVEAEKLEAARTVTAVRQEAAVVEKSNRRLLTVVATVSGMGALFAGLWWRHRRRQRRLERSADWAMVPADREGHEAELWRERALAAEARAEKATAMLRANLLPHMARWMMTELVQRLLLQRTAVQNSHQRAELEVAELAERLEKLQAPLEERRRAYETRIEELEAELAARNQQDHEFIQARIESTRRRLQTDREPDETVNVVG